MLETTVQDVVDAAGAALLCGRLDAAVRGISIDSREVVAGGLFIHAIDHTIRYIYFLVVIGMMILIRNFKLGIPRESGTMLNVFEIPSWQVSQSIFATELREATAPCVSL